MMHTPAQLRGAKQSAIKLGQKTIHKSQSLFSCVTVDKSFN